MTELRRFRITIDDRTVAEHPLKAWQRMAEFIEREAPTIVGHQNHADPGGSWIYSGEASSAVVTVLQAAARGDDLTAVLDLLDPPAPAEETRPA